MKIYEVRKDSKLLKQIILLCIIISTLFIIIIVYQIVIIIGIHKLLFIFETMKTFTTDSNITEPLIPLVTISLLAILEPNVIIFLVELLYFAIQIYFLINYRKDTKMFISNKLLYETTGYKLEIDYKEIENIYKKNNLFDDNYYIVYKKALFIKTNKVSFWIRLFQNLQSSEIQCKGFTEEAINDIKSKIET